MEDHRIPSKVELCEEDFRKTHHSLPDKVILSKQVYDYLFSQGAIKVQRPTEVYARDRSVERYDIFDQAKLSQEKQSQLERQSSGMEIPVTFARKGRSDDFKIMVTYNFGEPIENMVQI